ncbi:hypothetical protein [Labrys neptuniae]
MSRRETFVSERDEAYLGPVAIAQFIDVGWIRQWPKVWTVNGRKAVDDGFGRWTGTRQDLPSPKLCQPSPHGAAFWEGRRG